MNQLSEIFLPVAECAHCKFHFEREAGYYFGCVFPVLPVLSLGPALIFTAIAYFYFGLEGTELATIAVFGALFGFVVFFRLAVKIYIAIDHSISSIKVRR